MAQKREKNKSKPKDERKAVFTVLGEIRLIEGHKKLAFKSPDHYRQQLQQFPVGKVLGVTIEEYKATRSDEQLKYYWVLIGYLSKHTGHTGEELHDLIMREKFGTKTITIGKVSQQVRRSIADIARFPKGDMVELIQYALDLCVDLEIRVPTKQELGYLPG